jgi:peptidoglycan/LPS O-acetylase OafA/YrhL
MKYGESTFDILYLLFAIISGCILMIRAKGKTEKYMGIATLVLGCGDAFHLVPRVLNYFTDADMTAALGVGKLVTSVTMTVFYVLLYYVWLGHYEESENRTLTVIIWCLAAVRVILCLFPQNGWFSNSSNMTWGIIRNVPFVILGGIICFLYFQERGKDRVFRPVLLYILLSFVFYIPVAVGAGLVPVLGMLMLPKTICYILMIIAFLGSRRDSEEHSEQ